MQRKKNNALIDYTKFYLAILIVLAHYAAEWGSFPALLDYCFSLYIIVVPFFFACSGYFLQLKVNDTLLPDKIIYKDYIVRILALYGSWTIIYFGFKVLEWIVNGVCASDIIHYFHTAIVFTTYPTIWFLPACGVAAGITYLLTKKFSYRTIAIIALIVYGIGSLGYSYAFLLKESVLEVILERYNYFFITTRNGVFNGFPWFFMGCYIAKYHEKHKSLYYAIGSIITLMLVVIESVIIKIKFGSKGVDFTICLIPFIYFFMRLIILAGKKITLKNGLWMRKMSTLVFVSQRIFLTALPALFPTIMKVICMNTYIGAIYVLGATFLIAYLILAGSKKVKFLKYLQ